MSQSFKLLLLHNNELMKDENNLFFTCKFNRRRTGKSLMSDAIFISDDLVLFRLKNTDFQALPVFQCPMFAPAWLLKWLVIPDALAL